MKITYLGHASFLLETAAGTRIVTDPYAQDILPHPVVKAQVVTASHEHFDHCDYSQVKGDYVIVNSTKATTFLDVKITCAPCWHDEVQGRKRGPNRAYIFQADGLKIVHMGDLGTQLDGGQITQLYGADVAMVCAGSCTALPSQEAKRATDEIMAKVIIPMHYRLGKFGFAEIHSWLQSVRPSIVQSMPTFQFLLSQVRSMKFMETLVS